MKIGGEDIWYPINQPYGYWKVGNPIVKFSAIFLVIIGALFWNPTLIFQSICIIFMMIYIPVNPYSKFQIIFVNFFLGLFLVLLFFYVSFDSLKFSTEIHGVATIEWFFVFTFLIMSFSFWIVSKTITTRDYAWLIDIIPKYWRGFVGGFVYSFGYAILRFPKILWEADVTIRSRGGYRPFSPKILFDSNKLIDTFGIWTLYLVREMKDMVINVNYVIVSRVMLNKKTPIARIWRLIDLAIMGVLVLGVVFPWFIKEMV